MTKSSGGREEEETYTTILGQSYPSNSSEMSAKKVCLCPPALSYSPLLVVSYRPWKWLKLSSLRLSV